MTAVVDLHAILNTRCRLQRHADLRFHAGWVRRVDSKEVRIELAEDSSMSVGEWVSVEAVIDGAMVSLTCMVARQDDEVTRFAITECRVSSGNGQEPRYQTEDLYAKLYTPEGTMEADAMDISLSGLGVLCDCPVPRFVRIRLALSSGERTLMECFGRVCYCRKDPRHAGYYRVGVKLELADDEEQERWNRLVHKAAERSLEAA